MWNSGNGSKGQNEGRLKGTENEKCVKFKMEKKLGWQGSGQNASEMARKRTVISS